MSSWVFSGEIGTHPCDISPSRRETHQGTVLMTVDEGQLDQIVSRLTNDIARVIAGTRCQRTPPLSLLLRTALPT